jgi:hypothetical protein
LGVPIAYFFGDLADDAPRSAEDRPVREHMEQRLVGDRSRNASMTNLEQLAALLFDAIVNLDPQEFDAVADAVARLKIEDQASYSALMNVGCKEFAMLFGAIERAVTSE